MIAKLTRPLLILFVCAFCLITTRAAKADVGYAPDSKAVPVIIGIVAVGVLIVYFVVHHGHSLKGCTSLGPSGLQMLNEGDQQTYALTGDVDGIKTGDRVRVSGKKKKDSGNRRHFTVTKLSKDYGQCKFSR